MPGSGSFLFTCPNDYAANLPGKVSLLINEVGAFQARLTRLVLPHVLALYAREARARISYCMLPAELVCISFPTHRGSSLVVQSERLKFGEAILHAPAEHIYQRTLSGTRWGMIALELSVFFTSSKAITGEAIVIPSAGLILRLKPEDRKRFFLAYAQTIRLAETRLDNISHREVARALEQELIWTLMTCLAFATIQEESADTRLHTELMVRFEHMLMSSPAPCVEDISAAMGISEGMLNTICVAFIGMRAAEYMRARSLANRNRT